MSAATHTHTHTNHAVTGNPHTGARYTRYTMRGSTRLTPNRLRAAASVGQRRRSSGGRRESCALRYAALRSRRTGSLAKERTTCLSSFHSDVCR